MCSGSINHITVSGDRMLGSSGFPALGTEVRIILTPNLSRAIFVGPSRIDEESPSLRLSWIKVMLTIEKLYN